MFDKVKDLYALKKQADALKRQMESINTVVEHKNFTIKIRGDQEVQSITENGEDRPDLVSLFNKAIKESQKEVAKKMKNQLGGLGIPGL